MRTYVRPSVECHGRVEEITQSGRLPILKKIICRRTGDRFDRCLS